MYLDHYRLKAMPFQISADPGFLWMGDNHKEGLAVMRYCIMDNKGFLLLTGDVGTGKTTLIHALIGTLGPETIVAKIPDPRLSLADFYRYVTHAFHIDHDCINKAFFLQHFGDFLHKAHDEGKRVLLVVDEAQRLSPQLLEEIRVLSNIERPDSKLINIFFVGQNEFNAVLEARQNRALRQRIALNYHIQPLSEPETAAYITHRLKIAGAAGEIFSSPAMREVFLYSRGYPRLINILCDRAMLSGFVRDSRLIGLEIIRECIDEMRIPIIPPAEPESPPPAGAVAPAPPLAEKPAPPPLGLPPSPAASARPRRFFRWAIAGLFGAVLVGLGLGLGFFQPQGLEAWQAALASIEKNLFGTSKVSPPPHPDRPIAIAKPVRPAPAPPAAQIQPKVAAPGPAIPALQSDEGGGRKMNADAAPENPENRKAPAATTMPPSPASFPGKQAVIGFEQNSNELSSEHLALLDRLAGHLKDHPTYRVKLTGHTDVAGSAAYNLSVSRFRANIVQAYLVGKGISADRMAIEAFGPLKPAASNDTRTGREINRRVEIEVIEG